MQQTDVTLRKTECTPFTQKTIQQILTLLLFILLAPTMLFAETNTSSSFFNSLLEDVKKNVLDTSLMSTDLSQPEITRFSDTDLLFACNPTVNGVGDGGAINTCNTSAMNFSIDIPPAGSMTVGMISATSPGFAGGFNTGTSPANTAPGSYSLMYEVTADGGGTCDVGEMATITFNIDGDNTALMPGGIPATVSICEGDSYQIAATKTSVTFSSSATFSYVVTGGTATGAAVNGTGLVSATSDGTVTVDVTETNECGTSLAFTITVTMNDFPDALATDTNDTFCSGGTTAIAISNPNGVGGTFNWSAAYNGATGGATSATGLAFGTSITETLSNTTNAPITVTYTITPIGPATTNCADPAEVIMETVTVNPEPVGAASTETAVCSGIAFDFDPQDNVDDTGNGGNAVPSTYTWSAVYSGLTGGSTTGTGNVSETLTNTTAATINAVYTVTPTSTANSCVGSTFTITVPVDPVPNLDNTSPAAICSDVAVGLSYAVESGSVAATTYNVNTITVGAGLTAGGSNAAAATGVAANYNTGDTYTNTTGGALIVTYNVTPITAGGCLGAAEDIVVTINPEPVLSTALDETQCSDVASGITLAVAGGSVAASTYNITAINMNGLTSSAGSPAMGTALAAGVIADDAYTNTTNAAVDVVYTVVPVSADACLGDPVMVTLTVNPEPVGAASIETAVCSGIAFDFDPQDNVDDTGNGGNAVPSTYTWSAVYSGLTGGSTTGTGSVSETLTNTTAATINAVYTITPTSTASCEGSTFTITVPVLPELTTDNLTILPDGSGAVAICSGENAIYQITTDITGQTIEFDYIFRALGNPASAGANSPSLTPASIFATPVANATVTNTTPLDITQVLSNLDDHDRARVKVRITNISYVGDVCPTTGQIDDSKFTEIRPVPVIGVGATSPSIICSGDNLNIDINLLNGGDVADIGNNVLPINIDYSWPATANIAAGGMTDVSISGATDQVDASTMDINDIITNNGTTTETIVLTITPYTDGGAGDCPGDPITFSVMVEPTPAAIAVDVDNDGDILTETVCHNATPVTTVDVTAIDGNNYVVSAAVASAATVTGFTAAPYTRTDLATIETSALMNSGSTAGTVTYTIQPYTYGQNGTDDNATGDDCLGTTFDIVVTVEPNPMATAVDVDGDTDILTETVCHNATPVTTVDVTAIDGNNYVVSAAVASAATVTGFTTAPYTRTDLATIETSALMNSGATAGTVTYTIQPYTYGQDGVDNNATGDDCLGTTFNIVVTVEPNPMATAVDVDGNTNILTETICTGTTPVTTVDVTAIDGNNYVVSAVVASVATVTGFTAAPYTRTDLATIETGALMNSGATAGTVTYTIQPYTYGQDGVDNNATGDDCLGTTFDIVVTVEPNPMAMAVDVDTDGTILTETVCHNATPVTTVDVTAIDGNNYVVSAAVASAATVTGFTTAPYTRTDLATIETSALMNSGSTAGTVTYTIQPYTYGQDGVDNNATGDDCLGTTFDIVVTVEPNPMATAVDVDGNTNILTETVCHTATPVTTVDVTAIDGNNYVVSAAVASAATVTGFTTAPYTRTDLATIETSALMNSGSTAGTVTYTIQPYTYGQDGVDNNATGDDCLGTTFNIVVTVEPNPMATAVDVDTDGAILTETVCHNATPVTTVDVTAIDGNNYVVSAAVASAATVTGFTAAPYTRTDLATIETSALMNSGSTAGTVTYTIQPYTYGQNGTDDNATGDDCLGTTFDIVVTVEPNPMATAVDVDGDTNILTETVCHNATPVTTVDVTAIDGNNYVVSAAVASAATVTGFTAAPYTRTDLATIETGALMNSGATAGTVTYTIQPYTYGQDGVDNNATGDDCLGTTFNIVVTVEPNPMATAVDVDSNTNILTETICTGTTPVTTVDVTAIDGNNYVVSAAVSSAATVTGFTTAPYTRTDLATIETGALMNSGATVGTVTYTIQPYTYGQDGVDNNATGDDCLGTTFDIVVTVEPNPIAVAVDADGDTDILTETICHNTTPVTTVDVTALDGNNYVVSNTVASAATTTGFTASPYTRTDGATIETGTLMNSAAVTGTVTYTIQPYTYGQNGTDDNATGDDCLGTTFDIVVTVEPNPMAVAVDVDGDTDILTETICHNTTPVTTVDVTALDGNNYVVSNTVASAATTTGFTASPYTRTDGATIETGTLMNSAVVTGTVTYTIQPYTYGQNGTDDNATGDDCLGATFDVVVTVEPNPMAVAVDVDGDTDILTETICHNTTPVTTVDVTALDGNNYVVSNTVASAATITGFTASPYTRTDGATIETGALVNSAVVSGTVTYTIQPYTYGQNGTDDNATGDDCLGATFDVVITVEPDPMATVAGGDISASELHLCDGETTEMTISTTATPSTGDVDFEVTMVTGGTGLTGTLAIGDIVTGAAGTIAEPALAAAAVGDEVTYTFTPFIDANGNDMRDAGECQGTNTVTARYVIEPNPVLTEDAADPINVCASDVNTITPDVDFNLMSTADPTSEAFVEFQLTNLTITDPNSGSGNVTTSATYTAGAQMTILQASAADAVAAAYNFQDDINLSDPTVITQPITVVYEFTPVVRSMAGAAGTALCTGTPIIVTVKVNPGPLVTVVPPGPETMCTEEIRVFSGAVIAQPGASSPFTYAWTLDPNSTDTGNGTINDATANVINFTATTAGTVTLRFVSTSSEGCESAPFDVAITVEENVTAFTISTDAIPSQCMSEGPMFDIDLDASETGVSYELYKDGVATGMTAAGTGVAIDDAFTVTDDGVYTVEGTRAIGGCMRFSTNGLNFEVTDDPGMCIEFDINDPCVCNNDASTDGEDGSFSEIVEITGANDTELPAGQIWTVTSVSGAFADDMTTGPGATGAAIAVGDLLTFVPGTGAEGTYQINFDHIESQGYTITVEGPQAVGTPGNSSKSITNTCFYPNPIIVGPGSSICETSASFIPEIQGVNVALNGSTITWDDNADNTDVPTATWLNASTGEINPADATFPNAGNVTIYYHYDAADAAGTSSPGCAQTVSFTFEVSSNLELSGVITNATCAMSNGEIDLTVAGDSGTLTYAWSNGETTQDIDDLAAGTYIVTVTSDQDCAATASLDIDVDAALNAVIVSQTNIDCNGNTTGAVVLDATGGTAPYTYTVTTGAPSAVSGNMVTGLDAIAYVFTVTDVNGCTATIGTTITEPADLTATIAAANNQVSCNGESDGSATVAPGGGITPYTYLWSNGSTDQTADNLAAGIAMVTVTDANGCTEIAMVTITQPAAALSASIGSIMNANCSTGQDGSLTVTAAGGTTDYTYLWSNGATTATASGLAAGGYAVTVTDANGCTVVRAEQITDPSGLTATITASTDVVCDGDANGTATVTVTGGTTDYTYAWSAGGSTTATATGLNGGTVSVTVTDMNNCTAFASIDIQEPGELAAIIVNSTDETCNADDDGTATVIGTGGVSPYTYAWGAGAAPSSSNNTGLAAATYTVTVTDANLCTATVAVTIGEPADLTAVIGVADNNVSCNGGNDGGATVAAGGGTAPYTYLWSNGSTDQTADNLTAGNFTVVVTDVNGCTETAMVTITEPSDLTASVAVGMNANCSTGEDGSLTVTAGGGTAGYTYLWSNGATTATASGLAAGGYAVTVTDVNGCTEVASGQVSDPTGLTATITAQVDETCNADNDGSATVLGAGGTAPYTYEWSDGQTVSTAVDLAAGTYTVTITDANDCTAVATVEVDQPTVLVAEITSSTDETCEDTDDGTAIVNATGGVSPYTYAWGAGASPSSTNNTGLSAGTYTVTVTDANLCTVSVGVTISEPALLTASATETTAVDCTGGSTGSATVTPGGGTSPYTYLWSNGLTDAVALSLSAGTYTVTVYDANGCEETAMATVTEPAAAISVSVAVTMNADCAGGANGELTATAVGGTGAYTYAWSDGQTGASATDLAAGGYTVTATDANGCEAIIGGTITDPNGLTATITAQVDETCNADNDGSATVLGSGGTAPYTYAWSDGQTVSTAVDLAAGTYTVTITDDNGCTSVATAEIDQPTVLVAEITTSTDETCEDTDDGTATVNATGGVSPYTYAWGAGSSPTAALNTGLSAGSYTVTVTDANLCTTTTSVTIGQPTAVTAAATNQQNVSCTGGSDGIASVAAGGGTSPYTYLWTNGSTDQVATGLSAGIYTVTVFDANNCQATDMVTITEPASVLSVTVAVDMPANCAGGQDGQMTATAVGGTGAYTYAWSDGQTGSVAMNLAAGGYTVTATDANGCEAIIGGTITDPNGLTATITAQVDETCNADNDGSATVLGSGGTAPYTYAWSDGQTVSTAVDLSAGTYTVTITDDNGCTSVATAEIDQPTVLVAEIVASTNETCMADDDGTATVNATGGVSPYTYAWGAGTSPSSSNNTGLAAATYTVTVTDANLCTATATVTIGEPADLTASAVQTTAVDCNGSATGVATVTPGGGTTPYTYLWSNGSTDQTADNLTAGNFTVVVTDVNGCTETAMVTITEPSDLTASVAVDMNANCSTGEDGSLTVTAGGGTAGYTYLWSNGATTATASGLAAGGYAVTVTDVNGCTEVASGQVSDPTGLTATITAQVDETCNADNDGSATVLGAGGTAPYTYEWSDGQTVSTAVDLAAGTYTVTITDANDCTAVATVEVDQPTVLVAEIVGSSDETCMGDDDGTATVNATGGVSPYTYAWGAGDAATSANNTGLSAGTYTVTVTDANLCTVSVGVTISEPALLTASATETTAVDCTGGSTGSATVTPGGGTSPYTYLWSNGLTDAVALSLSAGTYTVTVYDANGCEETAMATVTEPAAAISVSVAVTMNADCAGGANGELTATAVGGTGAYTYAWSDGQTGASATDLAAGGYTVTATDVNGCEAIIGGTITDPNGLTATITAQVDETCNADNDGSATVLGSGGTAPYTYAWSDGQTVSTAVDLAAGTYTVTITDDNGCTSVATAEIDQPTVLVAEITTSTDETCEDTDDGTATVNATGGVSPYTYAWGAGSSPTAALNTGLSAGSYTVTVTDANLCTTTTSVTIGQPTAVTAAATNQQNVSCTGGSDGIASVAAGGGTSPYTYLWTNGSTDQVATGLSAGIYTVTVFDANNCQATDMVTITEPASVLSVTVAVDMPANCAGGQDGQMTATAVGGTGAYTYAWSDGQTGSVAMNLAAGGYTVTATDANGCEAIIGGTITDPNGLTATITAQVDETCNADNDGSATVLGSGGTVPYTYAWSDGQTVSTAVDLAAGTYTVTITDDNGCTSVATAEIDQPTVLVAQTIISTDETCDGADDGTGAVIAIGGISPYTFAWGAGDTPTAASNTGLADGTYTITITDANLCEATTDVVIGQGVVLAIDPIADITSCAGENVGPILLNSVPGSDEISYVWSGGAAIGMADGTSTGTNPNIPVFVATGPATTVSITVTATLGACTDTETFDITIAGPSIVFASCPVDIIANNDVDKCGANVNWTPPIAMNACTGASDDITVTQTMGPATGTFFDAEVAAVVIEYTATDGVGNMETCSFTIEVMDMQLPVFDADIVMPADVTAECSDIPVAFVLTNVDVNDNCTAPADLVIDFTEVSTQGADNTVCGPDGFYSYTITRTWTVTDEALNVTTHIQTLTIVDTTAPIAICQDLTIELDTEGMASIAPEDVDNGSSDNCAPSLALVLTLDNMDFNCNDLGENTVTLTVADPCSNTATCSAIITVEENPIVSCTPEYDAMGSDPCACKNNATDLINGQFDEDIQIIAPAGDTWTITANTGLFDASSAAPPAAPTPLAVTAFTNGLIDGIDNDDDGVVDNPEEEIYYTLVGIHIDALGYDLDVQSTNFGTTFNFTNTCFYPTIDFANLPSEICLGTSLELELSEANGGTGTTQFFVNGTSLIGNVFEGTDWGVGTHTITATFDAMDAGAFSTLTTGGVTTIYNVPTIEDAQADPGCISEVSTTIDIVTTPSQVSCNNMINVSLSADCESEITPDMALEGAYGCFDDYTVTLYEGLGVPLSPGNMVDASHIGQTLTFNLSHPLSGNVCWGEVLVEDKLAPSIECPADVTISCTTDVDNLALTGSPVVEDCSAFSVDYYDALTDNGPCAEPYTLEIVRTFVAVDAYGFADSCQQTILVERPDLLEVVFPADVVFSCNQVADYPGLIVGNAYTLGVLANHPDFSGIMDATGITSANALSNTGSGEPTIAGLPIQGAGSCMLAVLESDELYDVCGASYEILRTWKVRDMCAPLGPNNPREMTQIIKVLDEVGPVIITGGNITVSANEDGLEGLACTASFVIPAADVSDVCSDVVSIETIHPFGTNEANGGAIEGLEIGDYNITYVAEDACGNVSTQSFTVTVIDDIAPTPICDEITDVSLGAGGTATINAANLDDGSFDNCCLSGFLVARMDSDSNGDGTPEDNDFAETASFDCDDLDNNPIVVLRVSDCYGNFNQCMVEVQVEDNLAPIKTSDPEDQNISCNYYNDNLAGVLDIAITEGETNPMILNTLYGAPVYTDNCAATVTHSFIVDVNTCGEGAITRNWTAVDAAGNAGFSCTQVINVNHENDWEIEFPADVDLVCAEGMNPDEDGSFGSPTVFFDDCELIAISVENEVFNVVPDACYKIIRTYTAINWCAYEGINNGDDINLGGNRYRDVDDGIVIHAQIIKINDDINPVITCPTIPEYELDENCLAVVSLPELTDIEDCSSTINVDITSTLGTGVGPFNNVTAGTYTVTYTATDNCGNSTTCGTSFTVVDNKAPTPYCTGSLIIELMPVDTDNDGIDDNGMAETWATDFDAGSFDNCTAQEDLSFFISLTSDINDAATDGGLSLTCANVGGQPVYLFVMDEAGNTDLCQANLFVESVDNVCPEEQGEDDPVIAGILATEYDVVLENANVSLNTGTSTVTDVAGAYSLTAVSGTDVTVIPEHDVYDNTSVTTIDLVIIRQHILTTTLLDSPYKMIAADVNGNGSITAVDLVMARQVILGMATSYPNNTAWVFVDANHEFEADWELTDGYPAVVNINNIVDNHDNVDFVAVRVGDVNGTYGFATEADERSGFIIETEDANLLKGEQTTVKFSTAQEAAGYQFTLNYDKLKVVSIDGAGENFGLFPDAITTSFERDATGKLFAVTFEALENVQLSEVLTLDSRITVAEAYNNRGEVMNIALEFTSKDNGFALYQNVPNPFKKSTTIGFDLPNSTNVTFTVSDLNGKILLVKKGDYNAGYNILRLDELNATGVLYVQLETAEHTANIKMVKIK